MDLSWKERRSGRWMSGVDCFAGSLRSRFNWLEAPSVGADRFQARTEKGSLQRAKRHEANFPALTRRPNSSSPSSGASPRRVSSSPKTLCQAGGGGQGPAQDHHCSRARTGRLHLGHRDQGGSCQQTADGGLTKCKNKNKGKYKCKCKCKCKNFPKNEKAKI